MASDAQAATISGVTISLAGTNSPDDTTTSNTHNTSAISVLSSGGTVADVVDSFVSAKTRYASNLWVDAPNLNVNMTNSYDMSLSVSADPGTIYDISITTLFQGILARVDDSFFGESSAGVGVVQMTINSVVSVPHETSAQLLALGYYNASQTFSESGTDTLTDRTGTTNLSFNVSWNLNANSQGDEAAVLLGLDEAGGPVSGVSAGEYGNLSPVRNLNLDGHFITVTATVTTVGVPEPGTGLTLIVGLGVMMCVAARRRRTRSSPPP